MKESGTKNTLNARGITEFFIVESVGLGQILEGMGFHSRVKAQFSLVALDLLPHHSGCGLEVCGLRQLAVVISPVLVSLQELTNCEDSR
jgi:hypothetical protein